MCDVIRNLFVEGLYLLSVGAIKGKGPRLPSPAPLSSLTAGEEAPVPG